MLFNSYIFLFAFLPITIYLFFYIGAQGHHRVAIAWLVAASLFFYGWWNPAYLGIMLGSILFNYAFGSTLSSMQKSSHIKHKMTLFSGILANLLVLGYYKYTNFFIDNINTLTGTSIHLDTILLPLAISFFTFQQIAYLVDAYQGKTHEYNFLHYCLFVTFFPQLIAGPIVHHREMLNQFKENSIYQFCRSNFSIGITILIIGLFKKVVIADGVSVYVSPVFDAASDGSLISFADAWTASLAYTFQLYFDFSGYSDMAIGIARLFGIHLPLNFNSPYKSINIIEFWRRWHMTLSRFLRDYLYFPLGGNRHGVIRRYINLILVMIIGGFWHGAGWGFILWGALHGFYLILNHFWHAIQSRIGFDADTQWFWTRCFSILATFIAVIIAWVFFRATDFSSATEILKGMAGLNGYPLSSFYLVKLEPLVKSSFAQIIYWQLTPAQLIILSLTPLFLIIWFAPNTQQILSDFKPTTDTDNNQIEEQSFIVWQPTLFYALITAAIGAWAILSLGGVTEFLYFQF